MFLGTLIIWMVFLAVVIIDIAKLLLKLANAVYNLQESHPCAEPPSTSSFPFDSAPAPSLPVLLRDLPPNLLASSSSPRQACFNSTKIHHCVHDPTRTREFEHNRIEYLEPQLEHNRVLAGTTAAKLYNDDEPLLLMSKVNPSGVLRFNSIPEVADEEENENAKNDLANQRMNCKGS
ncbi:hypothetical protein Cni_G02144 [Canna indica]|uniref:Uncharacterized protein n=1 Tax=Canna indica TaxID=4628 RepID=A0AAQ3JPJ6_9LILI|nr:hypothetical protein Cni_G02144 [Canna indica]